MAVYTGKFTVSWRANFLFIFASGLAMLFFALQYREPVACDGISKNKFFETVNNYCMLIRNKNFIGYALSASFMYSCTTVYYLSAPFIFQNEMGLKSFEYGWLPALTVSGYIVGSLISVRISTRSSDYKLFAIGYIFLLVGISSLTLFFWEPSVFTITIPVSIFMIGEGIILPASIAKTLSIPTIHMKGAGAAILGFTQMLGAGISSAILSFSKQNSVCFILIYLSVITILTYLVFALMCNLKAYHPNAGKMVPSSSPNPTR